MSHDTTFWLHGNLKHWQAEVVNWFCLRFPDDPSLLGLTLMEGDHHFFEELHVFTPDGRHEREFILRSAQPLHIVKDDPSLTETLRLTESEEGVVYDLENLPERILLIKARFLNYKRKPFQGTDEKQEIHCGLVRRDTGERRILMHVHGDPAGLYPAQEATHAREAFNLLQRDFKEIPPIELQPGTQDIPFELCHALPKPTRIYLLAEEELDRSIVPGREVPLSVFGKGVPFLTVNPFALTPGAARISQPWKVALPVMEKDILLGQIGQPFVSSALLADLSVTRVGSEVWASWKWLGPPRWLRVKLSWDLYDANGWRDERDECVVSRPIYERGNAIRFFDCEREDEGWYLDLIATPLLFEVEIPSQRLTATLLLSS